MKNELRKTSIIVGVLFIIGTVAGSISVILTDPILGASNVLSEAAANNFNLILGAFFTLLMGFALVAVPLVMFPVLKKYNERIALGYIVARALEGTGYVAAAIVLLSLSSLGKAFVGANGIDAESLTSLSGLLVEVHAWVDLVWVYIIFNVGAIVFYYLLYTSNLIPRFLSGWGFVAGIMWLTGVLLVISGVLEEASLIYTVSFIPMFAQEMVMALWLIVKGFNENI